jgi:alpha-L-rhamnosidase
MLQKIAARKPFEFFMCLQVNLRWKIQNMVVASMLMPGTVVATAQGVSANLEVVKPVVNNLVNPYGIAPQGIRFGWQIQATKRNMMQAAYELRVQKSGRRPMLVWSSGRVPSWQSVNVPYQGPALEPNQHYTWQVRIWDEQGASSGWSRPATFHTGYADVQAWQAQWISPGYVEDSVRRPSPLLRKEFVLERQVARAVLFITAQGMYEARLNGQKVGNAQLTPGWTSYNKRLQYQAYDVTAQVRRGGNALAVTLGNGWYRSTLGWVTQRDLYGSQLALLAQLEIEYTDGTKTRIDTDASWKSSTGAIRNSEIYHGETIDLRQHPYGWDTPGFDDKSWENAKVQSFDKLRLIPTINEPVREKEIFKPVKIWTTPKGERVIDFGQNLVGWVRIRMNGRAGDSVVITHAEVLDKEGNMYYDNLRSAKCRNVYITDGKGEAVFQPHFSWQGFRYAAVQGFTGELSAQNIEAVAIYSDMEPTGEFSTDHALINQLQHNIQWGQRGNFLDVPTDCPQRDERLGWTGDAQAFFRTAAFNFNVQPFFAKWLRDLEADQVEGAVPWVVPNVLGQQDVNSSGWSDAATLIPWQMYLAYGDTTVLQRQFNSMKAYLASIQAVAKNDLWNSGWHFGDWLFYRPFDDKDGRAAVTDKYMVAQCFFAYSAELVAKAAHILGKQDEAAHYRALAERVKAAYQKEYLTPSGRLVSGTQTAYVLALQFDMLPEHLRQQAADRLAENVQQYEHITTGFLGTPHICHVLSKYGYHELATKLLLRQQYPSWLYPVTMGATTIWERWDGMKPDSTFQNPGMNSFNHYAYGAIGDWLYRVVAGIDTDPSAPGYRNIIIKPHPIKELGNVKASLQTPYGRVVTDWQAVEGVAHLKVTVPPNTTAQIILPAEDPAKVLEGGKPIASVYPMHAVKGDEKHTIIHTGSGSYTFSFPCSQ